MPRYSVKSTGLGSCTGMSSLARHPDVREGILGLESGGYRLVTLSNGSSTKAIPASTG
ncbi:hypothetical protein ABIB26_000856 [Arthrobacter sp. UYEF20]